MANPISEAGKTDPAQLATLRRLIGQRKRFDFLFSALGLSLIVLSLSVLAALAGKLLYDGGGRLWETHLVTPWGQTPGFRDWVGTFEKADQPDTFTFQPKHTSLVAETSIGDLAALQGKRVAVEGVTENGLVTAKRVFEVGPIPDGQPIPGKIETVGVLSKVVVPPKDTKAYAAFEPEPMRVKLPETLEFPTEQLVGQQVALTPARRGVKPELSLIEAKSITPLEAQTFFTAYPSTDPKEAGVFPALLGTLMIMITTAVLTLPVGVAAGVYLEEYAVKNRLNNLIEINIANLAGVPSVIWGLLGLGLFVQGLGTDFKLGESVLTAGLTLGLLVLPVVIIATREAIRAVPSTIREASIGLGATKWQTIRYHVLPYSFGGILTGAIIAMSRAVGETAPLLLVGGLTYLNFTPFESGNPAQWFSSQFSVLPMMTYEWVSRPDPAFHRNAAAGGIVLLAVTLSMNGLAIYLRYRLRRNVKW